MGANESGPPRLQRLQVFLPEGIRTEKTVPVDLQDQATVDLLRLCAETFGGATAYGRGVGAWRDEETSGAPVVWDRVTVVDVWIDPSLPDSEQRMDLLGAMLRSLCGRLNQRLIGCIVDGRWDSYRQEQSP